MTPQDEATFDPRIADWLEEDPNNAPDQAIEIVLAALPSIEQRHASRLPWRFTMPTLPKPAIGAAAIVVVVLAGAFLLRSPASVPAAGGPAPSPSTAGPSATPSPSPSPLASPTATPVSTVGWVTFSSTRYGYQIAHPPTWAATPASRDWVFAKDRLPPAQPGGASDAFEGSANGIDTAVTAFAVDGPAGTSEDAWLASYYAGSGFCLTAPTFLPVTVDGHAGRLDTCYDAQVFVPIGQREYVFIIWRTGDQPLLRAFLSTVKFQASTPSGSPGASASP
jgi:hypothetical protein